jgi:hypothetical protein
MDEDALQKFAELAEQSGIASVTIDVADLQALLYRLERYRLLRDGAAAQCERMRKRWLAVERERPPLDPSTIPSPDEWAPVRRSNARMKALLRGR